MQQHYCGRVKHATTAFSAIYSTFSVLFPVLELCPPLHPLKPSGACGQELYPPLLAFKAPLHSGTPQRTCGRSPATSAIWKIQVRKKKRKKKASYHLPTSPTNKILEKPQTVPNPARHVFFFFFSSSVCHRGSLAQHHHTGLSD